MTICNTNSASCRNRRLHDGLDGNYPDADSTEVSQCYKTKDSGGINFLLGPQMPFSSRPIGLP